MVHFDFVRTTAMMEDFNFICRQFQSVRLEMGFQLSN